MSRISNRCGVVVGWIVDDDSGWYVLDDAECGGLGIVVLNPTPVVVPIEPRREPGFAIKSGGERPLVETGRHQSGKVRLVRLPNANWGAIAS